MTSLFKKINLLVLICSTPIMVWNIYILLLRGNSLINLSVIAIFGIIIFSLVGLFKENNILRILQIILFFLIGIISVLDEPYSFYSIGIWSAALFLIYAYNIYKDMFRFLFTYSILVIILFSISVFINDVFDFYKIFAFAIYYILHIISLSAIFNEKKNEYEKKLLDKQLLADLGERITILVHDTKNHLQKIEGGLYILKQTQYEDSKEYVDIITRSLCDINTKFESILTLNKNSAIESFYLKNIIDSIIYLNQLTPLGRVVKFEIDVGEIVINNHKFEIMQMTDNIIKNAIEAGAKLIVINAERIDKLKISIKNNGPYISKCLTCKDKQCISCNLSSNKNTGHGIGIKSIQNAIKSIPGGELEVNNMSGWVEFLIKGDL